MRFLLYMVFSCIFLFGKEYYSKAQPYEIRDISSNARGIVVFADENMLGKKLGKKPYIKIDSKLDYDEIKTIDKKLISIKNIIKTNENILKNLKELLKRKKANYDKIKDLKIKSAVEKDKEFYDLINSENMYLNTKKEIENLKLQINDLTLRKKQLQKLIQDKTISNPSFVLYELMVKEGKVVNISTPLAKVADTSKAILTIYLDYEDLQNLKSKTIYLDGKKTSYKIDRLSKIADSKNISKYKAQIIIKPPKVFSKLVKVELR